MANRSTFGSVLPREVKRWIDLTKGTDQYIRDVRKLFIEAHASHKKWHQEMLSKKTNVDIGNIEETVENVSTT